MNRRPVNTDLAAGVLGLALVAVFWWGRGRLSYLSSVFPDTVLVLLVAVSLVLLAKSWLRPERDVPFAEGNLSRVITTAAAFFVWWWLIGVLGFFVASVLVFLFVTWYLARVQRQVSAWQLGLWLAVIIAEVGLFYFVFSELLYIRPPEGMFF